MTFFWSDNKQWFINTYDTYVLPTWLNNFDLWAKDFQMLIFKQNLFTVFFLSNNNNNTIVCQTIYFSKMIFF